MEHAELERIQYDKMINSPVKPLILKLAVPTIIIMLISSLYNAADTYFVSQLGKSASGAVSVVFSLQAMIQAIGFTLGMGSGSRVSRALGQHEQAKANTIASSALFASLILGITFAVISALNLSRFMLLLGATDTILPYAVGYGRYIVLGIPLMASSFVLNNLLRAEGKARFSMMGMASGALLNIALDPFFIFDKVGAVSGLNMGVSGAALATAISQAVSFFIMLTFFLQGKSVVSLSIRYVSFKASVYLGIIKNGLPSLCRQGFSSISTILLNTQASNYGDEAVSAVGIVTKVFMMLFCVGLGIGQGYQPVVGYNFSAGRNDRLKEAFSFTWQVSTVLMTVFGVLSFIFAKKIVGFFIDDQSVIVIGTQALRFQSVAMIFSSTNVMCNMTYQALGKEFRATLLSCLRHGFFFIPLVFLLPHHMGLKGVELVQAVSDTLACVVSIPFALSYYVGLKRKIEMNSILAE